mmetsp:Transcript_19723/g.47816  ORF Transcript_19723/g.47816 Transcript_19723/m.47816 type:complete len:89 (+) Transcript_19723:243-509(+)
MDGLDECLKERNTHTHIGWPGGSDGSVGLYRIYSSVCDVVVVVFAVGVCRGVSWRFYRSTTDRQTNNRGKQPPSPPSVCPFLHPSACS